MQRALLILLAASRARAGLRGGGSTQGLSSTGRALAAQRAVDQSSFNDMLDNRIHELVERSCHTVPAPSVEHQVDWSYAAGFGEAQFPLPPKALLPDGVRVGDSIRFTTREHNPKVGSAGKGGKSWAPDLWMTADAAAGLGCRFDKAAVKRAAGGFKRLAWGGSLLKAQDNMVLVTEAALATGSLYFSASNSWGSARWGWCKQRGMRLAVAVRPRDSETVARCEGGGFDGLLFAPTPTPPPPTAVVGPDPASALALERLGATVSVLSTQLMLAQTQAEERVRSGGSSGLVSVRRFKGGLSAWADGSLAGRGFAAMHNHGNFMDTVGMGEIDVVMNGVQFRTRHNDFRLQTPSTTSGEYGAVEPIAFPAVPDAVLAIQRACPTGDGCVPQQVAEMQRWFGAWKRQDATVGADGEVRDYTKHFQPALCYIEGAWVVDSSVGQLQGASDRHEIEASSWDDLRAKTRYMMNSGRKNTRENFAQLPASVRAVVNGTAVVANFEYMIKCQKLDGDVPLARFRAARDLQTMLGAKGGEPRTRVELARSRKARFEVHPSLKTGDEEAALLSDEKAWGAAGAATGTTDFEYLDTLMEQVWGKDNAGAELFDDLEGSRAMHAKNTNADGSREKLNVAKYSRYYQLDDADAMGFRERRRGFSDRYLWAARTTQESVSAVEASFGRSKHDDKVKQVQSQRWSYALPLEVVYLTPLTRWNPYNLTDHTQRYDAALAAQPACCHADGGRGTCDKTGEEAAACVGKGQRKGARFEGRVGDGTRTGKPRSAADGGGCDAATALDGTKRSAYYRTPAAFFGGGEGEAGLADPADTSGGGVCVLDAAGQPRVVRASGHNIFTNQIGGGVGALRQRWPVLPLHAAGSTTWKEIKALAALTEGLGADADSRDRRPDGLFGETRDRKFGFGLELVGALPGDHLHLFAKASKLRVLEDRERDEACAAVRDGAAPAGGAPQRCAVVIDTAEDHDGRKRTVGVARSRAPDAPAGTDWTWHVSWCQFKGEPDTRRAGECEGGYTTLRKDFD